MTRAVDKLHHAIKKVSRGNVLQWKLKIQKTFEKKLTGNIKMTASVSMLTKGVNRKFEIRSDHWKTTVKT